MHESGRHETFARVAAAIGGAACAIAVAQGAKAVAGSGTSCAILRALDRRHLADSVSATNSGPSEPGRRVPVLSVEPLELSNKGDGAQELVLSASMAFDDLAAAPERYAFSWWVRDNAGRIPVPDSPVVARFDPASPEFVHEFALPVPREDGYYVLDTLVVAAGSVEQARWAAGGSIHFKVQGPELSLMDVGDWLDETSGLDSSVVGSQRL